jgi:putative Mg2+ transporter-C (MgtC) family protein
MLYWTDMFNTFDPDMLIFILRLALAMLLGLLLGMERIYAHKTAGMRTYALVSMTSAFFVLIGQSVSAMYIGTPGFDFDPLRIAAQVVVGIGFLGAGLIVFRENTVQNLTTAAGMWTCSAIGMAVGFGLYTEAVFATFMAFVILGILSFAERYFRIHIAPKE